MIETILGDEGINFIEIINLKFSSNKIEGMLDIHTDSPLIFKATELSFLEEKI